MIKIVFIIAAIFVITPTRPVAAASLEIKNKCTIVLSGEIDKSTDSALTALYQSLGNGHPETCLPIPSLYLNSNGGDIAAAIRAGDFIRRKNFSTNVWMDKQCASACVILFLGGVSRFSVGEIGLHRPFSGEYSASASDSRNTYLKINRQISQYLDRMNIPVGLLDVMNAVPPGEIKWLTALDNERLAELHITGKDPVFMDQWDSMEAKRLGISKQEYYARQQRLDAICPLPTLMSRSGKSPEEKRVLEEQTRQCRTDVMNGLR